MNISKLHLNPISRNIAKIFPGRGDPSPKIAETLSGPMDPVARFLINKLH